MNAEQTTAFLKASKEVLFLLSGGVYASGATLSPYPVKEHHDLVTTKTIYTPLETILTARALSPMPKTRQEANEILRVVLEDMGPQVAPANGAHDYHKFVNTTTQYERQIAYLRELLNHTFLRAIYHTSTR
jgi:hypothetical protein